MSDEKTCLKCGAVLTEDEETYCAACVAADEEETEGAEGTNKVVGHISPEDITKHNEEEGAAEAVVPLPLMQIYMDEEGTLSMELNPDRLIAPTKIVGIFHELITNITLNMTAQRLSRSIAAEMMAAMGQAKQADVVAQLIEDGKKD